MLSKYLNKTTKTAPLAVFRFFFGLLMCVSIVRFWSYGWIDTVYVQPKFFFKYYGFEFIKPLGDYTYILFAICGISAFMVAIGYQYRLAIIAFFLSFTYIELIDKTPYLNHYYFVTLIAFLLIFLPANATFSLDAYRNSSKSYSKIPQWNIDVIKLMLAIVYVYAGLAKINSDWLLEALPLKIWLPSKYDTLIIGDYLHLNWVHYLFSWFGMVYDLTIVFFLLYKPTRKLAFVTVVVFHVLTHVLFPIGIFPYVMIVSSLIFFSSHFHERLIERTYSILRIQFVKNDTRIYIYGKMKKKLVVSLMLIFFTIQLLLPWRYFLYSNELFWSEEGYRFSWRVMLIEKVGNAVFTIVDPEDNTSFEIRNDDFLTAFQIKQMATQSDFILQYAHMLRDHYIKEGITSPKVFVKCHVTLNGRLSKLFIDPKVNLANEKDSFATKKWITPFYDTIQGL